MPFMQAFVEDLNTRFNRKNIGQVDASLLEPGKTVSDAAKGSQQGTTALAATREQVDYINKFPTAGLEALRDVLHWAVTQDPRVPVQFLWLPGPNFQVEFSNVAGAPASKTAPASNGGVSVLLRGPTNAQVIKQYPP